MGHGGPYSKRLRSWPHRHSGGDRSRKSKGGFPKASLSSGGGQGPDTAHLLERRTHKEANRAEREAKERVARQKAVTEGREALADWIALAGLSPAERNFLINAGVFPSARLVARPVVERRAFTVKLRYWPYEEIEMKDVQVGTVMGLPGKLAKYYPSGRIPPADIAILRRQRVL